MQRRRAGSLVVAALVGGVLVGVAAGPADAAVLTARGSVNQVQVTGATPGSTLDLHDGPTVLATGTADAAGARIFGIAPGTQDDVPAGDGYTVVEQGGGTAEVEHTPWLSQDVVDADAVPDPSLYDDQSLVAPAGYGQLTLSGDAGFDYLTTRDGTQLSVNVMAPILTGPDSGGSTGPWPVVIDYSGYSPSNPTENDPVDLLLRVAGFVVVGVNLRGTGCSGGAYSYFEPLQGLDGYDVVETVAAQPWVARAVPGNAVGGPAGPEVGLAGISFPGITQLFVGATQPPSLAAISPLSVIADTYRSTLYPGGILNNGFASDWAAGREASAEPEGQQWAADRIHGPENDTTCAANQETKLQAPPLLARFTQHLLYEADPGDSFAPVTFVDQIEAPTFIAGAFQDEQTGGHWSTMLDAFSPGVVKRAVLYNGTHADAITPQTLRDLLEFLDLYVARRPPQQKSNLRNGGPEQFAPVFGEPYAFPAWHGSFFGGVAPYDTQAHYDALDPVVLEWERGASVQGNCLVDRDPSLTARNEQPCTTQEASGSPFPRYITTYDTWPPPSTPDEWFLRPDGGLADTPATVRDDRPRGWSSYADDSSRNQVRNFAGSGTDVWRNDAAYDWDPAPEANSVRFVTTAYSEDTAYAGEAGLDLWVRSTAADTDLEATLSEVWPDGRETYIQSGWLRASHRDGDLAEVPLPGGVFSPATLSFFPMAAIVHEGSRLAVTISPPGGNRPFWQFDSLDPAPGTVNDIGHSAGRPSHLVLPQVALPANPFPEPPACGELRAQPCRTVPGRRPTGVTAAIAGRTVALDWTAPADAGGLTGYDVEVLGTGETGSSGTAGFTYEVPDGHAPPTADLAFRVTAGYPDGDAPSDASNSVPAAHGFTDVPRTRWYTDELDWSAGWGIVSGYADGTFRPRNNVTRGQFVGWLWRMLGAPTGAPATSFTDVPAGAWYRQAVDWAVDQGIATGFPGGQFRPHTAITRGQAARWRDALGDPTAPTTDPRLPLHRGQTASWLFETAAALEP